MNVQDDMQRFFQENCYYLLSSYTNLSVAAQRQLPTISIPFYFWYKLEIFGQTGLFFPIQSRFIMYLQLGVPTARAYYTNINVAITHI